MSATRLLQPRVCELGKIKIGGLSDEVKTSRAGNEYRPPEKYDHFVITGLTRDENGDLTEDVPLMDSLRQEGYADPDGMLRSLPVILLANDVDDILQVSYLSFSGKKMAAKSDGEILYVFTDGNRNFSKTPLRECPWKPEYATAPPFGLPPFKLHTTLNCVVASKAARLGGVYKFRTTSRISGDQLIGSLLHLKRLTGGVLRGLPFRLVVRPMEVSPEGRKITVYVVHLEMIGNDIAAIQNRALELARTEIMATKELKQTAAEYKALTAGDFLDDDDEAETASTFHPDAVAGEKTDGKGVERPTREQVKAERERTTWRWDKIVPWLNQEFGTQYTTETKFDDFATAHLARLMDEMKKLETRNKPKVAESPSTAEPPKTAEQPKGEFIPKETNGDQKTKLLDEIKRAGGAFFLGEFPAWLDRNFDIPSNDWETMLAMCDVKTLQPILDKIEEEASSGIPY